MESEELTPAETCLFVADVLSRDQDELDALLADVRGRWDFDECETERPRIGLLMITSDAFGQTEIPAVGSPVANFIYSLVFMMLESDQFEQFETYREQEEWNRVFARIWLLLGDLAGQWLSAVTAQGHTVPTLSMSDVFHSHGTLLGPPSEAPSEDAG